MQHKHPCRHSHMQRGRAIGLAAQLTHKHNRGDTTHSPTIKHTCTHNTRSTSVASPTWPTMAPTPVPHLGQACCLTTPHNNHSEGPPATSNTTQTSEQRCSWWPRDAMPRGNATQQSIQTQPHMRGECHSTRSTTHTQHTE